MGGLKKEVSKYTVSGNITMSGKWASAGDDKDDTYMLKGEDLTIALVKADAETEVVYTGKVEGTESKAAEGNTYTGLSYKIENVPAGETQYKLLLKQGENVYEIKDNEAFEVSGDVANKNIEATQTYTLKIKVTADAASLEKVTEENVYVFFKERKINGTTSYTPPAITVPKTDLADGSKDITVYGYKALNTDGSSGSYYQASLSTLINEDKAPDDENIVSSSANQQTKLGAEEGGVPYINMQGVEWKMFVAPPTPPAPTFESETSTIKVECEGADNGLRSKSAKFKYTAGNANIKAAEGKSADQILDWTRADDVFYYDLSEVADHLEGMNKMVLNCVDPQDNTQIDVYASSTKYDDPVTDDGKYVVVEGDKVGTLTTVTRGDNEINFTKALTAETKYLYLKFSGGTSNNTGNYDCFTLSKTEVEEDPAKPVIDAANKRQTATTSPVISLADDEAQFGNGSSVTDRNGNEFGAYSVDATGKITGTAEKVTLKKRGGTEGHWLPLWISVPDANKDKAKVQIYCPWDVADLSNPPAPTDTEWQKVNANNVDATSGVFYTLICMEKKGNGDSTLIEGGKYRKMAWVRIALDGQNYGEAVKLDWSGVTLNGNEPAETTIFKLDLSSAEEKNYNNNDVIVEGVTAGVGTTSAKEGGSATENAVSVTDDGGKVIEIFDPNGTGWDPSAVEEKNKSKNGQNNVQWKPDEPLKEGVVTLKLVFKVLGGTSADFNLLRIGSTSDKKSYLILKAENQKTDFYLNGKDLKENSIADKLQVNTEYTYTAVFNYNDNTVKYTLSQGDQVIKTCDATTEIEGANITDLATQVPIDNVILLQTGDGNTDDMKLHIKDFEVTQLKAE